MESAPSPPSGRRLVSIRAQLGWVTGLVLLLTLVVAVSGYVSLRRVQVSVETTLEQANRVRELGLEVTKNFLLARESEASYLSSWRSRGLQASAAQDVGENRNYLVQARLALDSLNRLVSTAEDPTLRSLTGEVERLRPLLDDYEEAFQTTVLLIEQSSRSGGLESQMRARLNELQTVVTPLPNPQFLELVLEIRANEQAYLNSNYPEYADNLRLLAARFTALAEASGADDLTPPGGPPLIAADLVEAMQTYLDLFTSLTGVNQQIQVQSAIFSEITVDIRLVTTEIDRAGRQGLVNAREQLQAVTRQSTLTLIVVSLLAVGLGAFATIVLARRIAGPLGQLSQAAEQMGRGELAQPVSVRGGAELVTLASAFNTMASQLRQVLTGLEQQVTERTRALQRRAVQLQAAAEVARDATAAGELGDLLNRAVALIRDRFGFYHAGIFLLDGAGEYAVLRAAGSEGGQRMLARGHRLKVGETGIVGWSAGFGQPRIALDVGRDAVFFDNPDLSETRSEMALPLKVRDRVIGVLDVQSVEPSAFTDEDVAVLQTMADQLAVAIENTRLLQDMQVALRDAEVAYGRYTQEAWRAAAGAGHLGYRYRGAGVETLAEPPPEVRQVWLEGRSVSMPAQTEGSAGGSTCTLAVPLKLRDQVVGVLDLRFRSESVSPETTALVEQVAERLTLALESARLLRETRALAGRERTIRQITEQIRRPVDVEGILQTAIAQLGDVVGAPRVYVRLGTDEELRLAGGDGPDAGTEESRHA